MTQQDVMGRYPKTVTLNDGRKVEIRAMTAKDRDAILEFARGLPEEDLLFLRVDLTEPAAVDEWVANLERGLSTSLLAYDGATLAGYATVHVNPARWTRRVGEIRVNAGRLYRGKGLGRNPDSADLRHRKGAQFEEAYGDHDGRSVRRTGRVPSP
jgi:hypothetical protein